jgi:hypothetical protein
MLQLRLNFSSARGKPANGNTPEGGAAVLGNLYTLVHGSPFSMACRITVFSGFIDSIFILSIFPEFSKKTLRN